jgi:uncharacterized protein YcbX
MNYATTHSTAQTINKKLHPEGSSYMDDDPFVNQHAQTAAAGTVVSLWRYPVKSMMGEEINSSYVTERGLIGDRTYAVIDGKTGKVASAKNPRKWGKLSDTRSIFIDSLHDDADVNDIPPVRITLPDGTNIFSDHQDDIDSSLSKVFGREVRLVKANNFESQAMRSTGLI